LARKEKLKEDITEKAETVDGTPPKTGQLKEQKPNREREREKKRKRKN
jgi:hypothetical protein